MGNGARIPSHDTSEKITRSLIGKKIVKAVFTGAWLHLDLEDGSIVCINATQWCSLDRVKYGGPFLEITKTRQKTKISKVM